jgi:hypothetical protein
MTKKKTGLDRLDVNLLVPFAGPMAEEVKRISHANSMPNTMVVRMIMEIGLEEIRKGRELKLVIPRNATA